MAFADPAANLDFLQLSSGMHVADVGSGSGFYAIEAGKKVGDYGKVYAIDIQKDLLDKLKNEARKQGVFNIEILWADAEEAGGTRLNDNSLDAAIISNLLFQIERKESFAKEISRILRPRGKVLLVDWSDSFGGLGPKDSDVIKEAEAEDLFVRAGFTKKNSFNAGDHHWGMVMEKSR